MSNVGINNVGRKKGSVKVKDHQIIEALEATGGLVSEAARLLNCTANLLHKRFRKNPEKWMAIREDIENRNIDLAESKLMENIKQGKEASIFFYLKCKGKKRGYLEKQEVNLSHSLDARTRPQITPEMTEVEAAQAYMEMIKRDKRDEQNKMRN